MDLERMSRAELEETQEVLADLLLQVSIEKIKRIGCTCERCRTEAEVSPSVLGTPEVVIHE